jgi:hypothetical protein
MGVKITRRGGPGGNGGPPKFNARGVAALIKTIVPGDIIDRTGKGIDMNGKQFEQYSRRYQNLLRRMGETILVDLRQSGGLINSIKARKVEITATKVSITVAPDTGTSPQFVAPSTRGELAKANPERGRGMFGEAGGYSGPLRRGASTKLAKALTPRKIKTEGRSPPHSELGYWLHHGTPTMKARPFMGLTPEQTKSLFDEIRKIMWL